MKTILFIYISTFILSLNSCSSEKLEFHSNIENKDTTKKYSPSTPITIISNTIVKTTYKDTIYPIAFEAVFMDSTIVREKTDRGENTYTFETISIGKIKIETGEIIACDPSFMQDGRPFTDKFPIGNFNVELAIAKIPVNNNRVAFSRIVFSNKPVAKWTYATRNNEKKIPINDSTLYGFPVDAGMAIYVDKSGRDKFNTYDFNEWQKVFITKMYEKENTYGYVHDFESHNLAAFSTGYGDGYYGSFIGLDKDGKICRLVSDLGILMWWKK